MTNQATETLMQLRKPDRRAVDALAELDCEQLIVKGLQAMQWLDEHAEQTRTDRCHEMFAELLRAIENLKTTFLDALADTGNSYSPTPIPRKWVIVKVTTRSGRPGKASLSLRTHMICVSMATQALRSHS